MRRIFVLPAFVAAAVLAGCPSLEALDGVAGGVDGGSPDSATESGAGKDAPMEERQSAGEAGCPGVVPAMDAEGGFICEVPEGSACVPAPVGTLTPTWIPPRAPMAACSADQIDLYFSLCWTSAGTADSCDAFVKDNPRCAGCFEASHAFDEQLGPLVVVGPAYFVNAGGCLALSDPCNLECAKVSAFQDECTGASCAACPGDDPSAWGVCTSAATACSCQSYTAQYVSCRDALEAQGNPAADCFSGDMKTQFEKVLTTFCGGG